MSVTYDYRRFDVLSQELQQFMINLNTYVSTGVQGPPPWSIEAPRPRIPSDVKTEHILIGGIDCLHTKKDTMCAAGEKAVLFIHGGGFVSGSADDGLLLLPDLTKRSGIEGFSVEYSLRPDSVYPVQLMECLRVYQGLVALGYRQIALTGVSAGGNLCLGLAQLLREQGLQMPVSIASMSAGLDFSQEITLECPDFLSRDLNQVGEEYAPGCNLNDPLISPFFADFHGFPPILLQAGEVESLHEWHDKLVQRINREVPELPVVYSLWEGVGHGFALEGGYYPEGYMGREQIITYLLTHFR